MEPQTGQLLLQLRTLSDLTRLRLVALCRRGECSVSELTHATGQSQPRVSQHLKQLCDAQLLERFRDGKRVYYRVPAAQGRLTSARRLLELIPHEDPVMAADAERLRELRGTGTLKKLESSAEAGHRLVHRLLLDLTVTTPLGDLLDIGCGRGRMLKLLASRANRAIGVDIDADARQLARTDLMLAGLPNCSLRQGDMYRLPFDNADFDTVILDDVLADAREPVQVLLEAQRVLRPSGRLLVLQELQGRDSSRLLQSLAAWSGEAGLRLAPPRFAPEVKPEWMLCVATQSASAAAA